MQELFFPLAFVLISIVCISALLKFLLKRPLKEIFWDWINAFFS